MNGQLHAYTTPFPGNQPSIVCIGHRVGPKAGLNVMGKEKIFFLTRSQTLAPHLLSP
jgi:hypothetical protein